MTMRDDLEDITALAVDIRCIEGLDSRFAEFLRDHGPALLEAVREATRWQMFRIAWNRADLMSIIDANLPTGEVSPEDVDAAIDAAIDAAMEGGE